MSTFPGSRLEDYLMYEFDLIVDGDGSANRSLQIAEAMGVTTRRQQLTGDEFRRLVLAKAEPYRESVEWVLEQYDEEVSGSWRDYGGHVGERIPDTIRSEILAALDARRED